MAMLVSRTDARGVDLKSSVYELLGRDLTKLNMLEELIKLFEFVDVCLHSNRVHVVCRLGLLSEETVLLKGTPLDTLTAYLEKSLAFGRTEEIAQLL